MALFYNNYEVNYDSEEWLNLSFGKALRELRRFEAMTMNELAEKSKVSQSYISQLENDVRLPSEKVISDLSAALARGASHENDDPFPTQNTPLFIDSYTSEFEIETRQQDFFDLLKKIKLVNESKIKREEYLTSIEADKKNVSLSSDDLELLKQINHLSNNERKFVLDFISFLNSKEA
ncbi:MAG: helix-turn-helix transcriptional regulator [Enterococcus hirae]|uniref:helix-turn-helix domain-containing protein n=2 Tax=Enterococcus hirae TaxID=1354 RepID=UPI00068F5CBD|nr:helix-turn-helix transcriptional regulator [Enterococcus hirae]HAQ5024428.1 helix-turn-helix transcriptional regulator [Enterococcus faecium]EMF0057847.1 helix-turn-helix transcriptional regulator [Enterococcus hirae]MCC1498801.1 helix-turn-helix transcriptional regulator [Enterococcus hirae]MCD5235012.1 helix-turn-helix transcriptional regulator [Enterococcus hirae]MCI5922995.1 helix-turn-helix transcriptional regulator [Enterococcus hirae]